jgi:ATP phosphoribosyltransferase regulatory subunit
MREGVFGFMATTTFRYPIGARPLLIEETARRRRVEALFVSVLERERFAEIVLPIIDFAEPYAAAGGGDARDSYRFTDRDGELVAVRSDFTPMVARALAPTLNDYDLPLRVFYRGDVIRCSAPRLGASRELFQIGAEIVGDDSANADVAILGVAAALAEASGATPLIVCTDIAAGAPRLAAIARALGGDPRFVFHPDDAEPEAGYDALYRAFGCDTPAAGFTFTLDDSSRKTKD